jgi:DNA-binding CsgD family transcriptional regulator
VERYTAGATVYELAAEFGIDRKTVARQLKVAGILLRLQSPAPAQVDEMVRLYRTGLSLAAVGAQLGFGARTVERHVKARQVATRDSHGRAGS